MFELEFSDKLDKRQRDRWIDVVEYFGYPRDYIKNMLYEKQNNHCTTTFYLLAKDQKKIDNIPPKHHEKRKK
jgi:hypothetical protein